MSTEAIEEHSAAARSRRVSKAGLPVALVAAWFILNDFAGLVAFAGAYFFNPVLVFFAAALTFGSIELVCCNWVDRNWDSWMAKVGPSLDAKIRRWRQGRIMKHPVRWATGDSTRGFALAALLTSGLTVVTVARALGGQPVGRARIRVAVLCYALFVAGVFTVSGYLAGVGMSAAL